MDLVPMIPWCFDHKLCVTTERPFSSWGTSWGRYTSYTHQLAGEFTVYLSKISPSCKVRLKPFMSQSISCNLWWDFCSLTLAFKAVPPTRQHKYPVSERPQDTHVPRRRYLTGHLSRTPPGCGRNKLRPWATMVTGFVTGGSVQAAIQGVGWMASHGDHSHSWGPHWEKAVQVVWAPRRDLSWLWPQPNQEETSGKIQNSLDGLPFEADAGVP